MLKQLVLAGMVLLIAVTAQAQQAGPSTAAGASRKTLSIGDPAPPLTIETWIKGAPVPQLKKGRVYVIEFWATWCGPCRVSIPHLTELQKKHANDKVTIIGVASSERNGLKDVRPFVEKMGDKMLYTIAFDRNQTTYAAWMQAAGKDGIPTAFVVNQEGRVAWIGHPVYPQGEMDRVLEQTLAGTYDVAAAAEQVKKIAAAQARMQQAAAGNDTAGVVASLDDLIALDTAQSDTWAIKKLELLLFTAHDYAAGYAWGARLVDERFKDNPDILNAIAWAIADVAGLEKRDLDLALRASVRASELTGGNNPQVLDTLARVQYEKGNTQQAVDLATKALGLVTDAKARNEIQARLDRYKAAAGGQ